MQHRFLLQILLHAQHFSGNTMPIIRSSRVLYSGCCPWYFVLWFSSCWSGAELRVMCPVCRMLVYQPLKVSTRNISWGKCGRCVWLKTNYPCGTETSKKIRDLNLPGTPLGHLVVLGDTFTFTFIYFAQ